MNTIYTKSAGGIVLNTKDEVLVVNQNGNSWSLPKGHVADLLTHEKDKEFFLSVKNQI